MDKLDNYVIINISEFLDYRDMINYFITSKTNYDAYTSNQTYIFKNIYKKYKLWIIDNPLSITIRTNFKGFTVHRSICSNHIDWFKKIHYKIL